MAVKNVSSLDVVRALGQLTDIEREVFLAMLDDDASYRAIADRLEITVPEAERTFVLAMVRFADAQDAPLPGPGVGRWLRRLAAAARLARRWPRR